VAQVPCVGVSVGVERIFAILEANAVGKATRGVDVFVASVGKGMLAARMAAARALWAAGISAEFWQNKENPRFAGPGSQLDYVLKLAIPVVVIVGEAEAASGRVKVKAIKYSKDGEAAGGGKDGEDGGVEVPLAGLAAYVAALLGKTATAAATAAPATPAAAATAGATPAAAPAGLLRPPPSKAEAAAVCLAPSVGLSATAKFAVLDLAHLAGRSVLAAPAAPPAAPPAEKAPAQQAAAEDEDEMDLGFDDEEDEDAPKAAAVVHAPGSRGALAAEAKAKRDAETEVKKQEAMARLAKKEANQRSLCNLEIKPWEASQDLKALYAKIQATVVMEGLKWSENCALVDVAFGVQKIVCTAVIPLSLSMDAIIDEMTEETFVDEIQSMNMTSMSLL
jgi:translation elongation factor EF-1beta